MEEEGPPTNVPDIDDEEFGGNLFDNSILDWENALLPFEKDLAVANNSDKYLLNKDLVTSGFKTKLEEIYFINLEGNIVYTSIAALTTSII